MTHSKGDQANGYTIMLILKHNFDFTWVFSKGCANIQFITGNV